MSSFRRAAKFNRMEGARPEMIVSDAAAGYFGHALSGTYTMRNEQQSALPIELYRPIAERIGNGRDLVSLSCVSLAMQIEAERLIYARFISEPVNELLTERIRYTPRLHPYIRGWTGVAQVTSPTLYAKFVPLLVNLETLRILNPYHALYEELPKCTFARLKEFSCTIYGGLVVGTTLEKMSIYNIAHVAAFLENHPSIERLTWNGPAPSFEQLETEDILSRGCLPNLTQLHAPSQLVMHLMPGRPISRLHTSLISHQRFLPSLTASSSPIVSLNMGLSEPELITTLITQHQQLNFLGEITLGNHAHHVSPSPSTINHLN